MAVTYTWSKITLDAYPSMYGETNVVYRITGTLTANDSAAGSASTEVAVGLPYDSDETFIAFDSITKSQCVTWIEANADLTNIKADLATNASKSVSKDIAD